MNIHLWFDTPVRVLAIPFELLDAAQCSQRRLRIKVRTFMSGFNTCNPTFL